MACSQKELSFPQRSEFLPGLLSENPSRSGRGIMKSGDKHLCVFLPTLVLLRSTLGERILFVSLFPGYCAISGFGRHLGLADQSPRFHVRAQFESRWLSEVPRVDSLQFTRDRTHFTNP